MRTVPLARWTGFLAGVALAAGVVLAGRMPAGEAAAPARLSIATQPATELGMAPAGREFLVGPLAPGAPPARGSLVVSNYTVSRVSAMFRLSPPESGLDRLVRVAVRAGGHTVYRGALGGLRSWRAAAPTLGPGAGRRVAFRAWLPRGGASGFEGRSVRLRLEWKAGR